MITTLVLLLLGLSIQSANAANWYVSSSLGSDSNAGSLSAPFASITKVLSVYSANDIVNLCAGDLWTSQTINIALTSTWTSYHCRACPETNYICSRPMLSSSYFVTKSGMTYAAGYYTLSVSNTVYDTWIVQSNTNIFNSMNGYEWYGVPYTITRNVLARYPNINNFNVRYGVAADNYLGTGPSCANSTVFYDTNLFSQFTDNSLVGSAFIYQADPWQLFTIPNAVVANYQANGTILLGNSASCSNGNFPMYIEGSCALFDSSAEWCYSSSHILQYYPSNLASFSAGNQQLWLSISQTPTVTINAPSVVFSNIAIIMSNRNAISIVSNGITINNVYIQATTTDDTTSYLVGVAIAASSGTGSCSVINSVIIDSQTNGIFSNQNRISLVDNCIIIGSGLYTGNRQQISGAIGFGQLNVVQNSFFANSGYSHVNPTQSGIVKNNYMVNSCMTTSDCGAIYTGAGQVQVLNNTVEFGEYCNRLYPTSYFCHGIYFDSGSNLCTAEYNVVNSTGNQGLGNGIFMHNANDHTVQNNILYNSGLQFFCDGSYSYYTPSVIGNNSLIIYQYSSGSNYSPFTITSCTSWIMFQYFHYNNYTHCNPYVHSTDSGIFRINGNELSCPGLLSYTNTAGGANKTNSEEAFEFGSQCFDVLYNVEPCNVFFAGDTN